MAAIDEEQRRRIVAGDLLVGETIRIQFDYANRGLAPVHDCQTWGTIAIVDPALNPGKQLRQVFLKAIREGYAKFKNSGNDLGSGISGFNFAESTPITAQQLV